MVFTTSCCLRLFQLNSVAFTNGFSVLLLCMLMENDIVLSIFIHVSVSLCVCLSVSAKTEKLLIRNWCTW